MACHAWLASRATTSISQEDRKLHEELVPCLMEADQPMSGAVGPSSACCCCVPHAWERAAAMHAQVLSCMLLYRQSINGGTFSHGGQTQLVATVQGLS